MSIGRRDVVAGPVLAKRLGAAIVLEAQRPGSTLTDGVGVLFEKLLARPPLERVVQLIVVCNQVVERFGILPAKRRDE